jgi:predicted nucleic acid-binding protein
MGLSYFDSSALLKRYLHEIGSDWVNSLVETEAVAVSELAYAEVASGLARRVREGRLEAQERDALFERFVADLQDYEVLGMTTQIIERAASALLRDAAFQRLRTLDALHLATAEAVFASGRRGGVGAGVFVTADGTLLAAARSAGLQTDNPEDHRA